MTDRDPAPHFSLRDVIVERNDDRILDGITTEIPCRGITVLAGPSGSGKTTLLRLLNRLDDPTSGSIRWHDRPLDEWVPPELRRRVAMVFQRPAVFEGTVLDNLRVARADLDSDAAAPALAEVDLGPEMLARSAADLSGGEAQRMCLARSLLTDPEIVLADEPTASLDETPRLALEALARRLADRRVAVIWVTHDIAQLRRIADHVIVLAAGDVLASGTLADLDRHPDVRVRALVGA